MLSTLPSPAASWGLWGAAALAVLAGVLYFVIASPVTPTGYKAPPTPVVVVAGMAYLVGAGLILVADRRLLTVGAFLNPLVVMVYTVVAIKGHAEIDGLSLTSKAAQIGLEVLLLGLLLGPGNAFGRVE